MQTPPVIEQMKLSEKDEVLAFLATAYDDNPRQSDPDFWDWHFPESPYCDPDDLPIWLARVDGKIAGQLAAVPVEFNVAGETVRAIWILDLIVDPSYRRRGIAKKLALASLDYCPFVLGINTSKQHSTELLEGLGWNIFTKVPRYQKMLFPGNAVREISRWRPLASAANAAFAPVRTGYRRWPEVRRVDRIGESFDDLWLQARDQWQCSVSRNSKMLEWQLGRQPGKEFEVLARFDGEEMLGYVVVFVRKSNEKGVIEKAAISDICYAPEDADRTIEMLLDEAVTLAIERQAGSVVIDIIDERIENRLKHAGFWKVKSDVQLLANVPRHHAIVYDAANWYLTRADSDISIFEAPNI